MTALLVVRLQRCTAEAYPDVLALARLAPTFAVERLPPDDVYVATFPELPHSIDLAVRLVGEVTSVPGTRVSINARAVTSLTRLWGALLCYRGSLDESDPRGYCAEKASKVGDLRACPDRACLSHCQFICTRCMDLTREQGSPPVALQLAAMARQAEVDWCPMLRISVK